MWKRALIFQGQGSQRIGMGQWLNRAWETRALDRVAHLKDVMTHGPESRLTDTAMAQPALVLLAAQLTQALREAGVAFDVVAGHSVGEIAALHAADALDAEDAVQLAALRGAAMSGAGGSMAAILGLNASQVQEALDAFPAASSHAGILTVANDNSASQVVVSGQSETVDAFALFVRSSQAPWRAQRVVRLQVSEAFHSPLMQTARDPLRRALEHTPFRVPLSCAWVANVSGRNEAGAELSARSIRDLLLQQAEAPVRWRDSVAAMVHAGVTQFVELGPASSGILSAAIKRDHPHVQCVCLSDLEGISRFSQEILHGKK